MSYSDAPVRQGRSPMFYVGIGCLALFGIGIIAVIVLGMYIANLSKGVQKAIETPVPLETVKAGLQDVPIYPGAQYRDSKETRAARAVMTTMLTQMKTAQSAEMATFTVSDAPDKTLAWYDTKLKAAGYTVSSTGKNEREGRGDEVGVVDEFNHSYRRDRTVVVVQFSQPEKSQGGKLMIMRFDGISDKFKEKAFQGGGGATPADAEGAR